MDNLMAESKSFLDRSDLLADVAEMYYLEGVNQDTIASRIGVTRSMVSRLLTEARQRGIVEIRIHRQITYDHALEVALQHRFDLLAASVIDLKNENQGQLLRNLGRAGAQSVEGRLKPGLVMGIAWGTSVSAVVDEIEFPVAMPVKIVQLVGAPGARNHEYDGHGLVARLAQKLGGEAYFLNAPFICANQTVVQSLLESPSIKETVNLFRTADIALVGVGSTDPKYSSFYLAGYLSLQEIQQLITAGAIGDVCGLHFSISGDEIHDELCERFVTIQKKDLVAIPVRIGVAGGDGKVTPILGALRGGFVNTLATDSITARKVLALDQEA
jgi:DNA-binding transcriptional regulator LsrR (DeoR family)